MIRQETDLLIQVEPIVRKAGDILLSYYGSDLTRRIKKLGGFVTEADIASEQYLMEQLAAIFPGVGFWAEESGSSCTGDYCWVIDPLDGTTNFSQNLPYFCISVALTYREIPQLAIVYRPLLNELFYAQRGKGAFLNGAPIKVSKPADLGRSILVVGLPYVDSKRFIPMIDTIRRIAPRAFAFRHFGAAALDQAYVACGRFDAVFFEDLAWWDVAAGMLLIQEAGGKVTDFEGNAIDASYKSFVASSEHIHALLQKMLQSHES